MNYKSLAASILFAASSMAAPLTNTSHRFNEAVRRVDKRIEYIATDGGQLKLSENKPTEVVLKGAKATLVTHLLALKETYVTMAVKIAEQEKYDALAAETPGVELAGTVYQQAIKLVMREYEILGDEKCLKKQVEELTQAAKKSKPTYDDKMAEEFPNLVKKMIQERKNYEDKVRIIYNSDLEKILK